MLQRRQGTPRQGRRAGFQRARSGRAFSGDLQMFTGPVYFDGSNLAIVPRSLCISLRLLDGLPLGERRDLHDSFSQRQLALRLEREGDDAVLHLGSGSTGIPLSLAMRSSIRAPRSPDDRASTCTRFPSKALQDP